MSLEKAFGFFSYDFAGRMLVVGVLVSLCAALLGVVLVLKRYSLIGHGLADVGFASLSLAVAVGVSPVVVSMPVVIITSFVIMYISQKKNINGDVAIGMFATGALSVGVIITALSSGFNMNVYDYMFGSILAVNQSDMIISVVLALVVIGLFMIFYNRLFMITVDENFAKASGINVTLYQFLISFLTAVTVVIGMKMIGTLLISSLIIFPAVIARKIVRSFKGMVMLAALISVLCFFAGIFVSLMLNLPTGASIVGVNIIVLLITTLSGQIVGITAKTR